MTENGLRLSAILVLFTLGVGRAADAQATQPKKAALLVGVNKYLKPGYRDLEYAAAGRVARPDKGVVGRSVPLAIDGNYHADSAGATLIPLV